MQPNEFDFIGETKLMGYGESDSSGCWIKLQVTEEDMPVFRGLKGEVFETAMRNVDRGEIKKEEPKKGPYGKFARDLVLSGFLNDGHVRDYFGGDRLYQVWTMRQPSAIDGAYDFDEDRGEIRNEYAHVRRSGKSGTAYKPMYSGIPLTHAQHQLQHQSGEAACLNLFGDDKYDEASAREWFEKAADKNLKEWMYQRLREFFSVDSLTEISPASFFNWAKLHDLDDQVPHKLRSQYGQET